MTHIAEQNQRPKTFTDLMRIVFRGVLEPIAVFFNRIGILPNTMTLLGLVGHTFGALFLFQGKMFIGGMIILAMAPIDALDGTMARLREEPSDFGAFVDSVTDRYSELVIFLALIIFYSQQGEWLNCSVVYMAAAGSVLVSYVRSRAESLGYEAKVGILTRLERYVVLVPSLIFNIPLVGLWIVAVMANFTAIQRIIYVRKQAKAHLPKKQ
ncbi:MAG: CDP-alcohol phosphatidyltransferase family protein [Anaerolineales bacterium]|nr:CDP-alcohol phosphatidyltransferase family protein [Anaerolineales bacterium]